MLESHARLVERIVSAKKQLARHKELNAAFVVKMDEAIGLPDGPFELPNLIKVFPDLWQAERAVSEIEKFIERRENERANIAAEIVAYARQHDIAYLLPPELAV
jgi:hypothetical protein